MYVEKLFTTWHMFIGGRWVVEGMAPLLSCHVVALAVRCQVQLTQQLGPSHTSCM